MKKKTAKSANARNKQSVQIISATSVCNQSGKTGTSTDSQSKSLDREISENCKSSIKPGLDSENDIQIHFKGKIHKRQRKSTTISKDKFLVLFFCVSEVDFCAVVFKLTLKLGTFV